MIIFYQIMKIKLESYLNLQKKESRKIFHLKLLILSVQRLKKAQDLKFHSILKNHRFRLIQILIRKYLLLGKKVILKFIITMFFCFY